MPHNDDITDIILKGLYESLLSSLYDLDIDEKAKLKKSVFNLKTILTKFNIYVGNVPPTEYNNGSLWFDTDELELKVYALNAWLYVTKRKSRFIDLDDTPSSFTGQNGKVLFVSDDSTGIVFKDFSSGMSNLSYTGEFTNTNSIYINHNLNTFVVNYKIFDEEGVEFIPNEFKVIDENNIIITMTYPMSGRYIIFRY